MNIAAVQGNWVGELIDGKFPLLKWLGGSQHSAVFLTELPEEECQKSAIKIIPADTGDAETRMSRWETAMGLSHPHLVRLFHIGRCEIKATPLMYVVMEYAEEDLSKVVPLRPLTSAETGEMLPPLLDVLSYVHEKQLVHGHIQPSNIMLVDDRLRLSTDDIERPGEVDITGIQLSVYDAPEIATGAVGPPADVWSMGVTLVMALTQHPPIWEKSDVGELMLPESVTEPFRGIIRACLRRDPRERCTVAEIKERLQPPSPPLRVAEEPAAMRGPKRRVRPAIATGLLALAVLVGIRFIKHGTEAGPTRSSNQEEQAAAHNAPRPSPSRNPVGANPATGDIARGAVAERVLPDVPQRARNTIRGTVRVGVRVSVNPAGDVMAARLDSPGPSRYFANLALQAAREWKFRPPQIDGRGVASEWILRFQFGRTETQVDASEIAP